MKLSRRLTALFMLMAIVPVVIITLIIYDSGRRTIEQEISNHLVSTNLLKSNELSRWIDDSKSSIEELAQRPLVRQYAASLSAHEAQSQEYLEAGRKLVQDHLLPRLKAGGFNELFVICPHHGIIMVSTDDLNVGKYRDDQPYYLQGKTGTYVYGVYFSSYLEQPAMTIGTPVLNEDGNLVAVLAGRLDLGELSRIISAQSGISRSEETYLVNTFQFFVTEPRFGQKYALKKSINTMAVQHGLAGEDGVEAYDDYRGVPVIGAFKWLPDYKMVMITEMDQSEAYAPIYKMAWIILGITLLLILIAVIIAYLTARTVTRPLRSLVAVTEQIGQGKLDCQVGTASKDEVGALSRAFDRMIVNLKSTTVSRDELRVSEERFRSTLDNMLEGCQIIGFNWRYLYLNDVAVKHARLPRENLIGRTMMEVYPGFDQTPIFDTLEKCMRERSSIHVENEFTYPDGEKAWHDLNIQPMVEGIAVLSWDVTEHKQAAQALEQSEKRYKDLFDRMIDGFGLHEIICDDAGKPVDYRFMEVNPAFETMTGLRATDVVGRTVRQVIPEIEQEWIDKYGRVALTGESINFESYAAGLSKYYEVSAFCPQKGRFATIFVDVTGRRKAEDLIRSLNAELEERVQERTAQLEAANKELEAFSYSVSHDLRAPLRAIEGYTRILQEDYLPRLDEEGTRICSVITDSAHGMQTLIDDLLAFSRTGRSELHLSLVDMGTLANSIYYELTTDESRERIDFQVETVPPAMADPTLIRLVWANLLSNAIKFSSHREHAVIKVKGYSGGSEVFYSIEDNGAGFDMQYAHKLYGVFQRLHSSGEFEGNGVGLAIVQRVVKRHGGHVWAQGEVEKGAIFEFTLPLKGGLE